MNLENAKQEFMKYVEGCDLENPRMKRKVGHSLRVMENSGKIAKSLNLNKEEVELAKLIGLLHDIAKVGKYGMNPEYKSQDHGDLGVEILNTENYIRKYIEESKCDNIIFKAIKNHNKFAIEEGLPDEEMLFAKIIRDADKLDIFYEGAEMFWNTEEEKQKIGNSKITQCVLDEFNSNFSIDRKKIVTPVDGVISFISFVFNINFEYDYEVIKREDYINKILNKFEFIDQTTKKQMEEVRKIADEYIKTKIRDGS